MSQVQVLLSHSSQNRVFAERLMQTLHHAGADVWRAPADEPLPEAVTHELRVRLVFLVNVSPTIFRLEGVGEPCRLARMNFRREPNRIVLGVLTDPLGASDSDAHAFLVEPLSCYHGCSPL